MFRLRLVFNSLILLAVVFASGSASVTVAGSDCASPYCLFLPLITTQPPVKITEFDVNLWYGFNRRIVGNVIATTPAPVYDVTIEARAFDANDQVVATALDTTIFTATLPGQLNPFDFILILNGQSIVRTEVEIVSWNLSSDVNYLAPTVVMSETIYNYPTMTVVTTIRNDYAQPLTNVLGLAWALESDFNFSPQAVTDYLAPEGTLTFTDTIQIPGNSTATVWVAVQGIAPP